MKNNEFVDLAEVQPQIQPQEVHQDPRFRNEWCDTTSIATYVEEYADRVRLGVRSVNPAALDEARVVLEAAAASGNRIYAIGNGGSAAIADHLCCDLTKGTHACGHPTLSTHSLSANVALYSAIANDFGFDRVFSEQIRFVGQPGDVLLAISSSGNSENILAAVEAAKMIGMHVIGVSGFGGGRLRFAADTALCVDACNYGVVEDSHQVIMHVLAQFIACRRDGRAE